MSRKILLIAMLFCTIASTVFAQDPRERAYHVPALNPKHKDKPKVSGWAKQRIEGQSWSNFFGNNLRSPYAEKPGTGRVYLRTMICIINLLRIG